MYRNDKTKISEAKYDTNGVNTHFVHYDKNGKEDTNRYLAKLNLAKVRRKINNATREIINHQKTPKVKKTKGNDGR